VPLSPMRSALSTLSPAPPEHLAGPSPLHHRFVTREVRYAGNATERAPLQLDQPTGRQRRRSKID